jgi:hypothetical protein
VRLVTAERRFHGADQWDLGLDGHGDAFEWSKTGHRARLAPAVAALKRRGEFVRYPA